MVELYGFLVTESGKEVWLEVNSKGNGNIQKLTGFYPLTAIVLMQWTGLKDKNEVEIFEGDIVECCAFVDSVVFSEGMFRTTRCSQQLTVHDPDGDDLTVIGNVHQDPELIKKN